MTTARIDHRPQTAELNLTLTAGLGNAHALVLDVTYTHELYDGVLYVLVVKAVTIGGDDVWQFLDDYQSKKIEAQCQAAAEKLVEAQQ